MTLDDIDRELDYPTLRVNEHTTGTEEHFKRRRFVQVLPNCELGFTIEWWLNISYLLLKGGVIVPFDRVRRIATWPNRANMNLQFYQNKEIVAVVPIA